MCRKSAYDILVEVYNSIDPTKKQSINWVAKENGITWRTARNALSTLKRLGLLSEEWDK